MIDIVPGWMVEAVETSPDGGLVAATFVNGDLKIRLVHPDYLLDQMADMDPVGKFIGSGFAELFRGMKLTPRELKARQIMNGLDVAADQLAKTGGGDPFLLVKKRRKRPSDFGRTK